MITNYFEAYRKKIDVQNLEALISDKEAKMKEYDEFLSSSAGSSLLINRLMSRNYVMTERAKTQDEEEKSKIEKECAIEFLALEDLEKNIKLGFQKILKKELAKYLSLFDKKNDLDMPKNIEYLTKSAIKEDDGSFARKFSQFVNELFVTIDVDGNAVPIQFSKFATARGVKEMYKKLLNDLYTESLNLVAVDYINDSNSKSNIQNEVNINSIPAGI